MYTCPFCGTNYSTFQPNCQNCGAPLPAKSDEIASSDELPTPPLPPRPISNQYVWRLFLTDGLGIAALAFCVIGAIFSFVGFLLTVAIITAFIGIPFLLLGLVFLGIGAVLFWSRYQQAQKIVSVLKEGDSTLGQIRDVQQNFSVRVNGRYPWNIGYEFQVNGQTYAGKVSTLNQPGQQLQQGKAVRVLYLPSEPKWSSIYPHP